MSLLRKSSPLLLRHRPLSASTTRPFFSSSPSPVSANEEKEQRNEGINKTDLIKDISETHELTHAKSERILNSILDSIVEAVADKKTVRLSKFGSFEGYESSARIGRNPSTGESINIPAKTRIRFKPYTSFKKTANGES
jgi:DNA-binding protein HU-beta